MEILAGVSQPRSTLGYASNNYNLMAPWSGFEPLSLTKNDFATALPSKLPRD